METEGSSSRQQQWKCPKQRNNVMNLTRYGRAKLRLVNQKNKRPLITIPENSVVDFTCHDYDGLRSGWITEDSVKAKNRLNRYYYDPWWLMYNTKNTVDCMCADIEKDREMIVVDKSCTP